MTNASKKPSYLRALVVTFLTPMFLPIAGGNLDHAHAAAMETISQYPAQDDLDLLIIAQLIAFGLAAVDSLGLATSEDLSVNQILRLRGNAVSANRAHQQCRRAMQEAPPAAPADPPAKPATIVAPAAPSPQPTVLPPQPASKPRQPAANQAVWADAMVGIAGEITAGLANLPPPQRRDASIRAAALSSAASHLLTGKTPDPLPNLNLRRG
jgi:hypothetical protein